MPQAEQLHARILEELDMSREVEDEELIQIIYRVLRETGQTQFLSLKERTALGREFDRSQINVEFKSLT